MNKTEILIRKHKIEQRLKIIHKEFNKSRIQHPLYNEYCKLLSEDIDLDEMLN